jgi:uncharacterized repeat protein (TIGR01451 family)/LPXTG-motif cell wall-anchored protein
VAAQQVVGLSMLKTASPTTVTSAGQTVTYSFAVTNTGNKTLTDVLVNDTAFSGTGTPPVVDCPVTTLAPQASTTCTATYTATQADIDAGSITNTATASGTPPTGPAATSAPSTATVTAQRSSSILVVKTASRPTVTGAGQVVTYSFHVVNTGNQTLTDVAINETQFSGTGTPPVIDCPATTLAPQGTLDCTGPYTVTQGDIDAGSITNTATVSGTPPTGPVVTSAPSNATVAVVALPHLTLVKSADPATVSVVGDEVDYTFTITNSGNVTLAGVGIDESAFSGSGTLSSIDCPTGPLAPTASVECTASYSVTQADVDAGSVTNTATAHGTAPDDSPVTSGPSSATVTVGAAPALTLQKSATPDTASAPGDEISYSFLVTNTGNVTLSNVAVDETAFDGSGTMSAIDCPASSLAPDAQEVCTASYAVTQADVDAGTVTNTATAHGTPPGSNTPVSSGPDDAVVTLEAAPALSLVKSADLASFAAGQVVTYSFLVTNTGNVTLHDIAIDEGAFSGSGDLSSVDCPATALAPDDHTTCTATYQLTQADIDAGAVTNQATATGTPPGDPTPIESAPSQATVPGSSAPSLTMVKSADRKTISALGQVVTYSFLVTNTGNVTLHGVAIDEGAFSGSGDLSAVDCPVTTLAPTAHTTCTATYAVTQHDLDQGSLTNTATAAGSPPQGPAVQSDPSTVEIDVDAQAHLALTKHATPVDVDHDGTIGVGDRIRWDIVVTNTGDVTFRDIVVSDPTAGRVTCPRSTLVPGETMSCTVPPHTITPRDASSGNVTNTAMATGDGGVAVMSSNEGTAHVVVAPPGVVLPDTGMSRTSQLVGFAGLLALLVGWALTVAGRRRVHRG